MSKTVWTEGDEGVQLIIKDVKLQKTAAPESTRAPVHVVYGGADRYSSDTPQKLGKIALASLDAYAPNFVEFAAAMRLHGTESLPRFPQAVKKLEKQLRTSPDKAKLENFAAWFAWSVYKKTVEKLKREPVEDFRIDFEDGYGFRTDEEEDSDALSASNELAAAFKKKTVSTFTGFRIKSFAPATLGRAIKTLELFLTNLLEKTGGHLPTNFVVTLPKVTDKKEVRQLCKRLGQIEKKSKLGNGAMGLEIMIETPESIIDKKGRVAIRELIDAAKGRCTSVHFGAYDYTAALGIAASHQNIRHPACSFARQMIQIALANTGVRLSDSVTTEIPVAIHRGENLSEFQIAENRRAVNAAWHTHFVNVTSSMINGYYQSWDLHPNQLVARYAAVYAFYLSEFDSQAMRLREFIDSAAKANLTGNTFDDAASANGLLNFFRQARDCNAVGEKEIEAATGLSIADLNSSSFGDIMNARNQIS